MAHDPKKLAYWADRHRSWQTSGLSQRSYCQREGLSFASFDYWRRRARTAVSAAAATHPQPQRKLTLVPVQLDIAASRDILLKSPAGWQVALPATLDPGVLSHLLSQLP